LSAEVKEVKEVIGAARIAVKADTSLTFPKGSSSTQKLKNSSTQKLKTQKLINL